MRLCFLSPPFWMSTHLSVSFSPLLLGVPHTVPVSAPSVRHTLPTRRPFPSHCALLSSPHTFFTKPFRSLRAAADPAFLYPPPVCPHRCPSFLSPLSFTLTLTVYSYFTHTRSPFLSLYRCSCPFSPSTRPHPLSSPPDLPATPLPVLPHLSPPILLHPGGAEVPRPQPRPRRG